MNYPKPPMPKQQQPMPGVTAKMKPLPDHGERSYKGSGRLFGKRAIITGGDSGIGRAGAIAFARDRRLGQRTGNRRNLVARPNAN
jgi:hypothetical protein